eukprot:2265177-Rhodomonas_salina.3
MANFNSAKPCVHGIDLHFTCGRMRSPYQHRKRKSAIASISSPTVAPPAISYARHPDATASPADSASPATCVTKTASSQLGKGHAALPRSNPLLVFQRQMRRTTASRAR